jgi:hypothetical protein
MDVSHAVQRLAAVRVRGFCESSVIVADDDKIPGLDGLRIAAGPLDCDRTCNQASLCSKNEKRGALFVRIPHRGISRTTWPKKQNCLRGASHVVLALAPVTQVRISANARTRDGPPTQRSGTAQPSATRNRPRRSERRSMRLSLKTERIQVTLRACPPPRPSAMC